MKTFDIPYPSDSLTLFSPFSNSPWAVFLESASAGRYDIICAEPEITLVTQGDETRISDHGKLIISGESPFALLRKYLQPWSEPTGFPFSGGAVGSFGYDLGIKFDRNPASLPDMMMGIYDWAIVIDHLNKNARLLSRCRHPETENKLEHIVQRVFSPTKHHENSFKIGEITQKTGENEYHEAFSKIKNYIRNGDCYQVNMAIKYSASFSGSPLSLFSRLRKANPSPYTAYLSNPYCQIICTSPERFLKLENKLAETKPIKGTSPRSANQEEDKKAAHLLQKSEKNRAENLMIVDLLRNDLSKVCEEIAVPSLFSIESFARVHHLVSTVTGKLSPGHDAISLLEAAFPGGSVTGAPKKRAMQIIDELEPDKRGVYCGAIGYIGFDGTMDTNIAIRTVVVSNSTVSLWAGGAIVSDSAPEEEYLEIQHKVGPLLDALKS